MKNKLKTLKDINFLTKLTLSEQEQINGGIDDLVTPPPPPPKPMPFTAQWPGR